MRPQRPVLVPHSQKSRAVTRPSSRSRVPTTAHRSSTPGAARTSSEGTVRPISRRAQATRSAGRCSRPAQARASRWMAPSSEASSPSQSGSLSSRVASSPRRAATPGAWASTMRAARRRRAVLRLSPVATRPWSIWSRIQRSRSARPSVTRCSRRAARARAALARLAAVAGSASGAGAGAVPAARSAALAARSARRSAHWRANSTGSPGAAAPSHHRCSRPTACLQGNLRDGQEQRKAEAARSAQTW